MTVIAYKDGVLACDSLWTDNDLKSTFKTKIRKLDNGLYIGSSGDNDDRALVKLVSSIVVDGNLTEDHFPSVSKLQDMNQSITMIVVQPDTRKIFIVSVGTENNESNAVYEITQDFYAVGSGSHIALGAMAAGASAEEACRIACRFELHCMEPIHSFRVTETKQEEIVIDSEVGC